MEELIVDIIYNFFNREYVCYTYNCIYNQCGESKSIRVFEFETNGLAKRTYSVCMLLYHMLGYVGAGEYVD